MEALADILNRQGITLSPADLERLKPVFQAYRERLVLLRALDLQAAEPAFVFRPLEESTASPP